MARARCQFQKGTALGRIAQKIGVSRLEAIEDVSNEADIYSAFLAEIHFERSEGMIEVVFDTKIPDSMKCIKGVMTTTYLKRM